MNRTEIESYRWNDAELTCAHDYLLPTMLAEMSRLKGELPVSGERMFELACGKSSVANAFSLLSWERVDRIPTLAKSMIAIARKL